MKCSINFSTDKLRSRLSTFSLAQLLYCYSIWGKKRGTQDGLICLLPMGHSKLNPVLTHPRLWGASGKMLFVKVLVEAAWWSVHREEAALCGAPCGSVTTHLGEASAAAPTRDGSSL